MRSQGKPKVLIAMSGGVDSSVAAAILKRAGFDVMGIFMKFWSDDTRIDTKKNTNQHKSENRCCSIEAQEDARRVAAKIGIPLYTLNLEKEFKKAVVDYFLKEYRAGRTPNPCVVCNKEIKFGLLFEKALAMGADFIATGHYARQSLFRTRNVHGELFNGFPSTSWTRQTYNSRRKQSSLLSASQIYGSKKRLPSSIQLLQARDKNKDQSYFLWTLNQEKLGRILFPVGDYTKAEVRAMARKWKLPVAEKQESQEICFVPDGDLNGFLKCHLETKKGPIATVDGKIIGEHEGLSFYTIGQRKGIKIPAREPYFVIDKDIDRNTLIIAPLSRKDALMKKELIVKDVNWISGTAPKLPVKVLAKIRYRHEPSTATLCKPQTVNYKLKTKNYQLKTKNYKLVFNIPQRAITPGQSVVFYKNSELLGGGIIASAF